MSQDQNQPEYTGSSEAEAASALFEMLGSEENTSEEPTADENDAVEDGGDVDHDDNDLDSEEFSDSDDEEQDASDEDGNDEEAEQDVEALYEVTLPGGETAEVSLDELRAGYSRTQDYTRKRQRDAAEHATLMQETQGKRDEYAARLEVLENTLRDIGPQKPDDDLRMTNPGEYAAQMADWQLYMQTLNSVGTERQGVSEEISQEQVAKHQEYVTQEWGKLVDAVPAWSDQAVAAADLADIRGFATEAYGFSEAELGMVSDARVVLMLKENMELRRGTQEAKETVKAKKAKKGRLRPGAQQARTPKKAQRKAREAAVEQASTSGSVRDAAKAISLLLED